jgi:hypothetical protein
MPSTGDEDTERKSITISVTKYVAVDTALSAPDRTLIARAIMDPMNEPNWNIAQKTPNALPLSFSSG